MTYLFEYQPADHFLSRRIMPFLNGTMPFPDTVVRHAA